MRLPLLAAVAVTLVAGCATVPEDPNNILYASYVGDQSAATLGDVTVAVPSAKGQPPFLNVHVALRAVVNPVRSSSATLLAVNMIISRLRMRVSAAAVEAVLQKETPLDDLAALRESVRDAAQAAFDSQFSKWAHANDFDVQVLVTGLYLTDVSVPPVPQQRFGWE